MTNAKRYLYNKNNGRCALCGKSVPYNNFAVDRITPATHGGTNELDNLQGTCDACNRRKGDALPELQPSQA